MGLIFGILPSWLSPLSARNPPMEMNQLGRAVEHFSNAQWSENELLLRIEFDRIANHLGQPDSDSLAVCEERLFKDLLAGQDLGVSVFR